jgi:DNA-binding IclR family transcriptional regulator
MENRMMGEDAKMILIELSKSENALSLREILWTTGLSTEQATKALDSLVAFRILQAEPSRHASEIGEMVYMFADNANAQEVYKAFNHE